MKTTLILTAAVVGWVSAGGAAAENYDFYIGLQYPGAKLRPGVELYKVEQAGQGDPKAYERREVNWWPRKGVDIIEVKRGMPLRTWTRLTGEPKQFEAHLVGFRGMGNTMSSKFNGDGGPIEPAVVLRLPDGRKRCFVRGTFGEEDKEYVMDLYVREMQRIAAGIDKTKRTKRPNADIHWPNNAKPGEPGTMQVECEHFIWISGSQAGSEGDPWVNDKAPDKAQWYRDGSIKCAEYWWALNEYAGNLMPYWDRKEKFKHEITVAGTKRDGHEFIGGYAGGGYGGCILKGAGGGPWAPGLWHEWGHGCLPNPLRIGGGEAQADMHQCLADPSMLKGNHHLKAPWRNIFNGSMGYGYTMFYNITCDDPNWGYAWFTCLPHGAEESSMFQTVARVGQQRGLFKNGIRGLGDMVGEYGARLATFDCELEDLFRRHYFAPTRSWLETVDRDKRIYRIPWEEAPEPFGVNIVRLVVDESAREFEVNFSGLHDPDFYSDWRACIVAVGADGKRRYSPMWNKGRMTMKCQTDDRAYWLTVAATPTAMYTGRLAPNIYSGRHAYRYPWSVQLSGARPGTPRHIRGEMDLTKNGKRHANGGGWVADTATVTATAFVGPDAMVLGDAQVMDRAIVEDYAVVEDRTVVSDHARVGGRAVVSGTAKVNGYSRTWSSVGDLDMADILPKRLGAEGLHKFGLWANYAMDRDENTLLEDWYRFAHGADRRYGKHLGTNLDGYLIGWPEFVADGDHRGFRFNGKTQYGELCPRLADLGAITVATTVKWEGQGAQTIFDFGVSAANRLVLKTTPGGTPELAVTVGGKPAVVLTAKKALPRNEWADLRVEIDGAKAALWVGPDKVAEKSSTVRPCDVFQGGEEKRNFLAASRDGTGHFMGIIDRVVVYHTVHEDFGKIPEPTRDAPRRPTLEVIEKIKEGYGDVEELNKKIAAKAREMSEPYAEFQKQIDARIKELQERDTAFEAANVKLKTIEEALGKRKHEMGMEFDELPETVKAKAEIYELRKQSSEIRTQIGKLQSERLEKDEELTATQAEKKDAEEEVRAQDKQLRAAFEKRADVVEERKAIAEQRKQPDELQKKKAADRDRALNKRWDMFRNQDTEYARLDSRARELAAKVRQRENLLRDEVRRAHPKIVSRQRDLNQVSGEKDRTLRGKREKYVSERTAETVRQVAAAKAEFAEATEKALAPYLPEKLWARSFGYQAYRGYYNTNYSAYIRDHVKAQIGGGEMRDDVGFLEQLQEAVSGNEGWSTSVDWDWRMKQEADGSIKDLPLLQKWIRRSRGPVVTENAVGSDQ